MAASACKKVRDCAAAALSQLEAAGCVLSDALVATDGEVSGQLTEAQAVVLGRLEQTIGEVTKLRRSATLEIVEGLST